MAVTDIVIVGAGGHGRELVGITQAVAAASPHAAPRVVGILDDGEPDIALLAQLGVPFLGNTSRAGSLRLPYVIGIGDPTVRRTVDRRLSAFRLRPAEPLLHPTAWVGPSVTIGPGSVVFPFVSITTNVQIGAHVHLSSQVAVAHDTIIGDYVSVYPGACLSGNTQVGEQSLVGSQAVVLQGRMVGVRSTVGAGATVVNDVANDATVIGTPARPMVNHQPGSRWGSS